MSHFLPSSLFSCFLLFFCICSAYIYLKKKSILKYTTWQVWNKWGTLKQAGKIHKPTKILYILKYVFKCYLIPETKWLSQGKPLQNRWVIIFITNLVPILSVNSIYLVSIIYRALYDKLEIIQFIRTKPDITLTKWSNLTSTLNGTNGHYMCLLMWCNISLI